MNVPLHDISLRSDRDHGLSATTGRHRQLRRQSAAYRGSNDRLHHVWLFSAWLIVSKSDEQSCSRRISSSCNNRRKKNFCNWLRIVCSVLYENFVRHLKRRPAANQFQTNSNRPVFALPVCVAVAANRCLVRRNLLQDALKIGVDDERITLDVHPVFEVQLIFAFVRHCVYLEQVQIMV